MFQTRNEYFMRTKLKELAAKSGLTGREIAKQLDVTPETVSRHMNGRTAMSFDDAARYSELIGCSPEALIFEPKGIDVIGEIQPDYSVQTFNIIDGHKTAIGLVYPDQIKVGEPATYSVSNTRTGMPLKNLNIVWATPILTIYTELSLLGIEIID